MAGDRQRFNRALDKWDALKESDYLSVPKGLGQIAIFCSYAVIDIVHDKLYKRGKKDVANFRNEAFAIADRLKAQEYCAQVILNASLGDFASVLKDPKVSDIITIGHGDLSTLLIGNNEELSEVDWLDVSNFSDHLKTGQFVQRQCGNFTRDLSVPLGLFSVSDHSNIIAPSGMSFTPYGLDHPDNDFLRPVTDNPRLSYREAKNTFSY